MSGPEEEVGGRKSKKSFASRIATIILKLLIWANFRALEILLSLQLGLKKWGMVPKERIEDYVSCEIPLVTEGLFEGFESGRLEKAGDPRRPSEADRSDTNAEQA